MAITTLADIQSGTRQYVDIVKGSLSATTAYASLWATGLGAGSLAIGNTANGLVPTNATAGAAPLNSFSGDGYITNVVVNSTTVTWTYDPSIILIYDRIFHAGSFAATVGVNSLSSQPSFSSRVPGGNYSGLQIWAEMASAKTGSSSVRVKYTNQDGTTGQVSPTVSAPANGIAHCIQIPYVSGDSGVQAIEEFEVTAQSSGCTWNVFVARPIMMINTLGSRFSRERIHGFASSFGPRIYSDSCLACLSKGIPSDSTTPPLSLSMTIVSK